MSGTLSDDARVILAFIRKHPGCTFRDIESSLGVEPVRIVEALADLEGMGLFHYQERINRHRPKMPDPIRYYPS